MGFLAKIRNLIKFGRISGGADNQADWPVQQLEMLGLVSNGLVVTPYGDYSNVPDDALAIVLAVEGHDEKKVMIAYTPTERPRDLEQGETAKYHPKTQAFIKFRNNGNIEIETGADGGDLIVKTDNAHVTAAESVTVETEVVDVTAATSVRFDTPTATFTGDVNVEGEVTADSAGAGVTLTGHEHAQGNDSDGDSEQDTDPPTPGT